MFCWIVFRQQWMHFGTCWYVAVLMCVSFSYPSWMSMFTSGGFVPIAGSDVYYSCLPGSYSASTGASACVMCAVGTFASRGASVCSYCNISYLPGAANCDDESGESLSIVVVFFFHDNFLFL